MPRGRPRKLTDMEQLDGKLVDPKSPTTLDEILGEFVTSKYHTNNIDEYIKFIDEMNSTDLQRHAQSVGLIPSYDIQRLRRVLISEFKKYISIQPSPIKVEDFYKTPQKTVSPEAAKILSQGR